MLKQKTNGYSQGSYFSKYGEEFQRRLLISLLNDKIFFQRIIDIIKPEYFDNEVYKWLFNKVSEIYLKRRIIPVYNDLEILSSEEENIGLQTQIRKEIDEIKNLQVNIDLGVVKDKALEFCQDQEVKNAILLSVDLLKRGDRKQIRDVLNKALSAGEERTLGHDYFSEFDIRVANHRENVVPTDWYPINNVMAGGLAAGELGVVIAGTGVGKTLLGINLGVAALRRGINVVHYTLEVSPYIVGMRYDARISDIAIDDVSKNKELVLSKIEEYKKAGGNLIIKGWPTKTASLLNIRTHIQQIITQNLKPGLVIVDYADLIKPTSGRKEKRHELEDIYEDLRALGGELGCGVWSFSQVNRLNYGEEIVTVTGFAEAFAKGHVSDFVMSFARNMKDPLSTKGTIFIAKNRNGPTGGIFSADVDPAKSYVFIKEYDPSDKGGKEVKKMIDGILIKTGYNNPEEGDTGVEKLRGAFQKFKNKNDEIRK